MKAAVLGITILITMELVALLLFHLLKKVMKVSPNDSTPDYRSIGKGILERTMLFLGLIWGIQSVIILFGALKIATRLDQDKSKVSNDYFLIGNLMSVLIAFISYRAFTILIE
jgi:hypothetical protein